MKFVLSMLTKNIPVIAVMVVLLVICLTGYLKAPPDKAYIISGIRKKTIIGKASVRIPFLERYDVLDLSLIPIDVKTKSRVPTADYINIFVDAIANVKISTNPELLPQAAQNFLNRDREYIASVVQEILEGNMREIVGKMRLQDMVSDRKKFAEEVKEDVIPDLQKMGLELVNFNVQNFTDENGIIDNLGVDNISQIKKNAAIAKAEADKSIAQAQADSEKEIAKTKAGAEKEKAIAQAEANRAANEVQVRTDTAIAEQQNALAIKRAQLQQKADNEQAIANAAGEIQAKTQMKAIVEAEADAELTRQERQVMIREKEVAVREKALEAEVKKTAEASKYASIQKADAELYRRQKEAEAAKFEREQEAAAMKAQAEAQRYRAEQEAAGIRAKGEAEAAAIRATKTAEAEGVLKLAEAQAKMGEASVIDMYLKALPEVARAVADPLSKVDSITMYGDGNAAKLTGDITKTMNKVMDGMNDAVGFDIKDVLKGILPGAATPQQTDLEEK